MANPFRASNKIGSRWKRVIPAGLLTIGLTCCVHPIIDQTTVDGLKRIQTDASALFKQLQQSAPGCSYASNQSQFDQLSQDLASLEGHVKQLPNDDRTAAGLGNLQNGLNDFRKAAAEAANGGCLPANVVQDKQSSFAGAVDAMLSYEQQKPKEN